MLACWIGYSYFRFEADKWAKENWSHPVTYTMPASAQIINQYASEADFFGDFDYCAAFRVSDVEYDGLLQNGFNWIYMGQGSATPTLELPKWQNGDLPEPKLLSACFDHLTIKPDDSTAYRYLFEEGKDWKKLLVINEKEKIIFYYRTSW